jgi:hypothetical protein
VIRFTATLLSIFVCSLSIRVACSADAPDTMIRVAAISALDLTAPRKTPTRVVAADPESRQSSLGAAISYQGVIPREATVPLRGTFDLGPADLRSIPVENPQQVAASADSDEAQAVTIVAAPLPPEEKSNTHLSLAGIGSLYWAARHPAQAWRVLLPIQPHDGSDAYADARTKCAVFTNAPSGIAACP